MSEPRTLHVPTGPNFGRAVLRTVIKVLIGGVVAVLLILALEIPFAPWIRSFGLWPTLTGEWYGTVTTERGEMSYVWFDVVGMLSRHGSDIRGRARWCDDGAIRDYSISGDPDDWRGTRFHLSLRRESETPRGLGLSELRGVRSGDAIRAEGTLVSNAGSATATAVRGQPPVVDRPPRVTYVLHRGNERQFLAACGVTR